jgi:transcription-repair coupling factor (superfamily II helicase)
VDYLNRFKTTAQKKETLQRLAKGEIDIIIGTHALVGKDVKFKDLGLLVIDEEQKFGVAAKDKLKTLRTNVDTLTLTATPIPRTLQFSLMSARDLSVINTPPPNRFPVQTEIHTFSEELIRDAVSFEIQRGGQVFFVHNRVSNIMEIAGMISRLVPNARVAIGHGQMEASKLEEIMVDFIEGQYDVLVSTTIIESGLDVSNANTMIINDAHNFGLSDLHQMRGRVGRSNRKAFCYLITPPVFMLTSEAQRRLKAVEEFSDLGAGFHIALRDLDIRGAGNLLGGEQSGFIGDIGFDMYQKILDEAIQELKETDFKDLFKEELAQRGSYVRDVTIETDVEMLIPDEYVSNTQERLNLYTELNNIRDEEGIAAYAKRLEDRFGKMPRQVGSLFDGLRLQWLCKKIGFERLILKGGKLRCYFISDPQSSFFETAQFQLLLAFLQKHGRVMGLSLKQTNKELILVQDELRGGLPAVKRLLEQLGEVLTSGAA